MDRRKLTQVPTQQSAAVLVVPQGLSRSAIKCASKRNGSSEQSVRPSVLCLSREVTPPPRFGRGAGSPGTATTRRLQVHTQPRLGQSDAAAGEQPKTQVSLLSYFGDLRRDQSATSPTRPFGDRLAPAPTDSADRRAATAVRFSAETEPTIATPSADKKVPQVDILTLSCRAMQHLDS